MGDVKVDELTLEKAKDKVHATHLSQQRKLKKKAMAVPCVIYDPGSGYSPKRAEWCGLAFFRGLHAGNGAVQYALPDGTKIHGEGVIVWGRHESDLIERLLALTDQKQTAQAIVDKATSELHEMRQAQGPKMYAGQVKERGYGHAYDRPTIRNDAAMAQTVAEALVDNVLKPREDD